MAKKRFTDLGVERLRPPAEGRIEIRDADQKGLRLRVTPAGQKTWALLYRIADEGGETEDGWPLKGKLRRMTLGTFPMMKVEGARDAAREALKLAGEGLNPTQKRKHEAKKRHEARRHTVQWAAEEFIRKHAEPNTRKPRQTKRTFEIHVIPRWGDRPVSEITQWDAQDLMDEIVAEGTPHAAAEVRKHARHLFKWLRKRQYVTSNPFDDIDPPVKPVQRDRVLVPDEILRVWRAAEGLSYPFGPFVKLLLLTAARRSEIAGLRWSWVHELDGNDPHFIIPAAQYKSGRAHVVPLSTAATKIVRSLPRFKGSDYVLSSGGQRPISGFSKAKKRLDKTIAAHQEQNGKPDIPSWQYHDLRRTVSTELGRLGTDQFLIDRVLGHALPGVRGTYNRYAYLAEKRVALEAWTERLRIITSAASEAAMVP